MRKKILFIAGMMACCTWAGAQEISQTWVADKGNALCRLFRSGRMCGRR